MTFADYEAAKVPGDVWEYAIRTKYPTNSALNIDSDAFTFTVPWYGVVEGEILAGESDVGAKRRVCSRLKSSTTSSDTSVGTVSDAESPSLASYTYVVHSNSDRISDAYKVTDTQTGTSVQLDNAEHLKIDLNIFSSVSSVGVCVASTTDLTTAPEFIVRVMDYDDPDDAGNTGNMCIEDEISSVADGNVCIKYSCVGTHISVFLDNISPYFPAKVRLNPSPKSSLRVRKSRVIIQVFRTTTAISRLKLRKNRERLRKTQKLASWRSRRSFLIEATALFFRLWPTKRTLLSSGRMLF